MHRYKIYNNYPHYTLDTIKQGAYTLDMTKENIEEQITSDYDPAEDPEFFEQAKWVCMDLGIPEDEAEMLVEDYLFN